MNEKAYQLLEQATLASALLLDLQARVIIMMINMGVPPFYATLDAG